MKRFLQIMIVISMILSCCPFISVGAGTIKVSWNEECLTGGELTASISGVEDGVVAFLAVYSDGGLTNVASARPENSLLEISVNISEVCSGSIAKLFLWNEESIKPEAKVLSVVTPEGIENNYAGDDDDNTGNGENNTDDDNTDNDGNNTDDDNTGNGGNNTDDDNTGDKDNIANEEKEIWVSDNQINNHASSVAYHEFDALNGEYVISFSLTVNQKGDNAVLIGSSENGDLIYGTASALLLFNNNYFSVRNGDGNGGYSASAVNLCAFTINETYFVVFEGNATNNTYKVSITDESGNTYTSGSIAARKNASALDTIAFISNSNNTTVTDGQYSNYLFYASDFTAEAVIDDPVYSGFAGMYYGIKANGKYIRGNNGKISADYTSVKDSSAMFFPRNMGDGSYAFLCRSSDRRITSSALNGNLTSADYVTSNASQHWIMEKAEEFTDEMPAYYLKSMNNGFYIGVVNGYLTAVNESRKAVFQFEALYDESPLYLVSQTEAYAMLSKAQRARLEEVYESVAGDIFGRYGSTDTKWTERVRMDSTFSEVLDGSLSVSKQYSKLCELLNSENGYIIENLDTYNVSKSLPETNGLYCKTDGGEYGSYVFWNSTVLKGTRYTLTIYEADGTIQQTINLYVHDDGVPKQNAETLKEAIVQIPYSYRKHIKNVRIRSDNANSFNGGGSDIYIRLDYVMTDVNRMLGTLIHECSHGIDQNNGNWSIGSGWADAMKNDMYMTSVYANSSNAEDFAEFGRLYFACCGNQDMQKALQILFPERYASYYRLRNSRMGGFSLWEDTETLAWR